MKIVAGTHNPLSSQDQPTLMLHGDCKAGIHCLSNCMNQM